MKTVLELRDLIHTTSTLLDQGHSQRKITTLRNQGKLHQLQRGIFCWQENWGSLTAIERYKAHIIAHQPNSPNALAYTHITAATVYNLATLGAPAHLHIASRRQGSSGRSHLKHHYLPNLQPYTVDTLPVPSLIDTVQQCAQHLPLLDALIIADSALARGMDYQQSHQQLQTSTGRGARTARKVAQLMSPRCESPDETLTRLFLTKHGYPPATEQLVIHAYDRTYRPDFVWEAQRIILEFDGNIKYTQFGDSENVYAQQNEREAWLRGQGWNVVRTTWNEVIHHPHRLKAKLDAAFADARHSTYRVLAG